MIHISKENGYAVDLGSFEARKCPLPEGALAFMKEPPPKFIKESENLGHLARLRNQRTGRMYKRPSATLSAFDSEFLEVYSEEYGPLNYEEILRKGLRGDFLLNLDTCRYLYTIVFWGCGKEIP